MIFLDQTMMVIIVGQMANMKAGETKRTVWQTPSLQVLTMVKDPWVVATVDLMLLMVVMAWTKSLAIAVSLKDLLCTW